MRDLAVTAEAIDDLHASSSNVMSLPVRSECRRLAAVPLHSQLNHPKGGCITPLGRLKVSPGEDHAADDCRQRSVGYKVLVLPVSGGVAVVNSWQAARVWMRGLKSEAERGLYTEAGRQHY